MKTTIIRRTVLIKNLHGKFGKNTFSQTFNIPIGNSLYHMRHVQLLDSTLLINVSNFSLPIDFADYFIQCGQENPSCMIESQVHEHCRLCEKTFNSKYKCRRHFNESHMSRMLHVGGRMCFPCKLKHEKTGCERAHYHCPQCEKTILNRNRFVKHVESHKQQHVVEDVSESPSQSRESAAASTQNGANCGESADSEPQPKRRRLGEKKECPICKKQMDPRSVPRHLRDIHGQEIPKSVCVDEGRGIYMVRKSSKGGVAYPIHVQKSFSSSESIRRKGVPFCEDDRCRDYMDVAWRSGMNAVECRHIQQVGANSEYQDGVTLNETCLKDISYQGNFKILKRERMQQCLSLSQAAASDNAQLIVSFPDGERFIHFSVYDGQVHYYAKLRRVVVTCNLSRGELDCACCRRKRGCVHKAICLWYLRSAGKLDNFRHMTDVVEDDAVINDTDVPAAQEMSHDDQQSNDRLYPPAEPHVVARMCRYLTDNKRIPLSADRDKSKPLPHQLVPVEKECTYCLGPLSKPVLITRNATILTMDSITTGVETYFVKCAACRMCYRYQECSEGVHNFNDVFILGIDVCAFLRESLKNHIPLGSMIQVLEGRLKSKLNSQTVVNAYLHYDALSDHEYNFYCSLCGFHPHTVIMDLNRKVAFQCSAETLRLPENYNRCSSENDVVDCEQFWSNVELAMVVRGFPGTKVSEFDIQPDLLNWAPFLGRKTRVDNQLVNTEHKKVRQEDGQLEQDCREITEERLLEMLHQSTLKEIHSFAKQLGLNGAGSKLDIIMNIKSAISNDNEKFKKAFGRLWGCSGGWASATCPHGVVYALKFVLRSESPRDYVDILMSMKHQPNITILDVANMVAAHGNNRKENMFHPHSGKVVESTPENVAKGKNGELDISLDWLDNSKKVANSSNTEMAHPVTGSEVHLCLFDRLHERNVKKEDEVLRRVTHVRQLKGLVNTQTQEQLNNFYNKDSHFLNSMKPVNHIFLFRSNIDFRNEKVNLKNLHDIQAAVSCTLSQDMYGRVMIDKTKKSTITNRGNPIKLVNPGTQTNVTQTGLPPSSSRPANAKTSQPIHFSLPCHSRDIHLNPSNVTELSEPRRPEPPSPTSSQLNDWPDFPEIITHSTSASSSPTLGSFPSRPSDTWCPRDNVFDNPPGKNVPFPANQHGLHDPVNFIQSHPVRSPSRCDVPSSHPVPSDPPKSSCQSEPVDAFPSRPPGASCQPTAIHYLPSCPLTTNPILHDSYWIPELNLHMTDKEILQNGHWVNDRIILATFRVLKKDPRVRNLAGLQDVISATKHGYTNKENFERFVQIVNVRGNHWVALSNVKTTADRVFIYDSYVNLNRKKDAISYPLNVEQCACQLIKPVAFVNMYVANVQQQKGGNDCGLFSIANAVALCFGIDPTTLKINQHTLSRVLIDCLYDQDFSSFINQVSRPKNPPLQKYLFEWVCRVHCHCTMPDDGQLMVSCRKCKRWFHSQCEEGNFRDPRWICRICKRKEEEACERAEWRKAAFEAKAKLFKDLRKASLKHHERESLVLLYDQINDIVLNNELPSGDDCCGWLSDNEYMAITNDTSKGMLGVTWSDDEFLFIVIFKEKNDGELAVFRTLLHEMIHAIKNRRKVGGTSHGKEYKKVGKEVITNLKLKLNRFPKPYCDFVIDDNAILAARYPL